MSYLPLSHIAAQMIVRKLQTSRAHNTLKFLNVVKQYEGNNYYCVKVSGKHFICNKSYAVLKSKNWICVTGGVLQSMSQL